MAKEYLAIHQLFITLKPRYMFTKCRARSVVVVNHSGKLRFTYTGPPFTIKTPFRPVGITADRQGWILTATVSTSWIRTDSSSATLTAVIYRCVDTRDYLFVGVWKTGRVKKIQNCTERPLKNEVVQRRPLYHTYKHYVQVPAIPAVPVVPSNDYKSVDAYKQYVDNFQNNVVVEER
uniref:Uncharacterized protein n=1 Tax=Magallana gigas TaxID=29159 RepID=K1PMW4_MAGGI